MDIEDLQPSLRPGDQPSITPSPVEMPAPEVTDRDCICTAPSNCDCLEKAKDSSPTETSNDLGFATSSFLEMPPYQPKTSPPKPRTATTQPQVPRKTSFFFNTPLYTREEVATHNTPDDCWLIANGNVYNATPYLNDHPAGARAILRRAGKDCTTDFEFHSSSAQKRFRNFKIGEVDENSASCSIC